MKRKTTRIAIIFLLAGLMTASFALTGNASANPQGAQGLRPEAAAAAPGGAASAPAPAEAAKTREEVVYANLSATGGAEKIYAVTLLHPGGVKLYDYGDFENVVNLTDMTEIEGAPGGIAVDSDAEAFYYQADLVGAQLPWAVDVTYTLDGAPVQPDRLAGAAGALGVSIRTAPAARENVFSKNYMLTISVTLDAIHCQNIASQTAQIASSGTDRVLTFVTMPDKEETHAFTADVRDFEMGGIQIAAVPYQLTIAGDSEEDLDDLDDGTSDLLEGSDEIKDGLAKVSKKLKDADFDNAGSGISIDDGSAMFDQMEGLNDLKELPPALNLIAGNIDIVAGGLGQLTGGAAKLKDGYADLSTGYADASAGYSDALTGYSDTLAGYSSALEGLDQAMAALPDGSIDQATIAATLGTIIAANPTLAADPDSQSFLQGLAGAYLAGSGVRAGYEAQIRPGLMQVEDGLTQLNGGLAQLNGGLAQLNAGLAQSNEGLEALTSNIGALQKGLQAISAGLRAMATELEASLADFDVDALKQQAAAKSSSAKSEITAKMDELKTNLNKLSDGIEELSDGYGEFHDGLVEYTDGVTELSDALKSKDFEPVSFLSPKNGGTTAVQFVLKTEGIELPEVPAEELPEEEPAPTGLKGFAERVKALFGSP